MDSSEMLKPLIYGQLLHFSHLQEQLIHMEAQELAQRAQELKLDAFPGHLTSVHVLECIGNHEPINSTAIAEKMSLSKAAITKISTKLLAEGFIKRNRLNDNRKEIYFRLTPKGRQVYDLHETLHKVEEQRFLQFLGSFPEQELHVILNFFQQASLYLQNRQSEGSMLMKADLKAEGEKQVEGADHR